MSSSEASAVLRAEGISVNFGGVRALNGVDLEVRPGSLVGLIGPNGAGKTTFVDAVTGFVTAKGTVSMDGVELTRLAPHERARRGLARTWQSIELFDDLTVGENLAVAQPSSGTIATFTEMFRASPIDQAAVVEALELVGIEHLIDARPNDLSHGQRKLAGVARALVARPRVLCLDEPAAGLDTSESNALGAKLRQVVDSSIPILLIDHDMGLILTVCDYVYVLNFGTVIAEGEPDEVKNDPRVISAYLGRAAVEAGEEPAAT